MTYEDLVAACSRTVGAAPGSVDNMHDVVLCLMAHGPSNRAIVAEFIARVMAEYIEGLNEPVKWRH